MSHRGHDEWGHVLRSALFSPVRVRYHYHNNNLVFTRALGINTYTYKIEVYMCHNITTTHLAPTPYKQHARASRILNFLYVFSFRQHNIGIILYII